MQGFRFCRRYAQDVNKKESKTLSKLISSGAIFNLFREAEDSKTRHCIFFCRDLKTDNIIGWAIIIKRPRRGASKYEFMVYIKRAYRRKGIGTLLYRKCRKVFNLRDSNIIVYDMDNTAKGFFGSVRKSLKPATA